MHSNLNTLFDELFPICRSITGEGIRASLKILSQHMPLNIKSVPTGRRVFDWTVPREWKLNRATLQDPDGNIILDTNNSNLHVLNFSVPFQGKLALSELQDHLHSIPDMPNAIPYVTSYYKERWGLCLSDTQRQDLKEGEYTVNIDTELSDGVLNYATCELAGDTTETILISSYLCHPSLANNELSGPLCMVRLYQQLAALPSRRYTYKFVLAPETIGSISFLSEEGQQLKDKIKGGVVLTCLGGSHTSLSFKLSRRDWLDKPSAMDKLARHLALNDSANFGIRDFDPTHGSDERHYCSPGINLPVIQAARTVYGAYPEYHTSEDTKELMTIQSLEDSCEQLLVFLQLFELSTMKLLTTIGAGEPQLGKHDLYPTINTPTNNDLSTDGKLDGRQALNALLQVISLSDGDFTLLDMAEKLELSATQLLPLVQDLIVKNIIRAVEN